MKNPFPRSLLGWAQVATITAALAAVGGVVNAARINARTASLQAEITAVELLHGYMRLSLEHPDLANRAEDLPAEPRYEWFAAHAYVTAEAIYRLMRGNPAWDSTVAGIVQYHKRFVLDGKFACPDFDSAFATLVSANVGGGFRCMRQ